MADYQTVVIVVLVLALVVTIIYKAKPKAKPSRRAYYTEKFVKILYNPFTEKHTWTRLNPETHIWEWQREATADEVEKYSDVVFPAVQGEWILNSVNADGVKDNG